MSNSNTTEVQELQPELAAIFQQPIIKRYGVVQFEQKLSRNMKRHEVLKIYMRRHYPTPTMRADLVGSLNETYQFCVKPYFKHPKTNKKRNMQRARCYLKHISSRLGFQSYRNRVKMTKCYKDVMERMQFSLKTYIEELLLGYQKADHIHFLHEILFIKNLQTYPFPEQWVFLVAFYHGMPEYERLLAAIRVITDYDGDHAPEFEAEMF